MSFRDSRAVVSRRPRLRTPRTRRGEIEPNLLRASNRDRKSWKVLVVSCRPPFPSRRAPHSFTRPLHASTMLFNALALLAASSLASATIFVTTPVVSSSFAGGASIPLAWIIDVRALLPSGALGARGIRSRPLKHLLTQSFFPRLQDSAPNATLFVSHSPHPPKRIRVEMRFSSSCHHVLIQRADELTCRARRRWGSMWDR